MRKTYSVEHHANWDLFVLFLFFNNFLYELPCPKIHGHLCHPQLPWSCFTDFSLCISTLLFIQLSSLIYVTCTDQGSLLSYIEHLIALLPAYFLSSSVHCCTCNLADITQTMEHVSLHFLPSTATPFRSVFIYHDHSVKHTTTNYLHVT